MTLFTRDLEAAGDNAVAHNILGNVLGEQGS